MNYMQSPDQCGNNLDGCESIPRDLLPSALGIPGWTIPERSGFVPGKFRVQVQSVTTVATSFTISGEDGGWKTDPNLLAFMPADGDFVMLVTAIRLAVSTDTPNDADAVEFGQVAGSAYLAHSPSGDKERRFSYIGNTYRPGAAIQAKDATAGAALHMTWYNLSLARPIYIKQDDLSLEVPAIVNEYIYIAEFKGVAINKNFLGPCSGENATKFALLDRVAMRYGNRIPAGRFRNFVQRLRAAQGS